MQAMLHFYRDVLGFPVQGEIDESSLMYVEFESEGVRFAICRRSILRNCTQHASYDDAPRGHAFELAFPCESPDAVDAAYADAVRKGAAPIRPPSDMPWGQRAAFFADPDGHIHEFFAPLPPQET
jgi:lactoylglutathione lyase